MSFERSLHRLVVYVSARFRLTTNVAPILVTYVCAYALFGAAAGSQVWNGRTLLGALGFVLLFLHLRLVDDLEDRDPGQPPRPHLFVLLGLVDLALLATNIDAASMILVAAIVVTTLAAAFWLKPALSRRPGATRNSTGRIPLDAILAVVFEGTHLLIAMYVYLAWSRASDGRVSAALVWAVALSIWASYEFWKYSRYTMRADWAPYGITRRSAAALLLAILAVAVAAQLSVGVLLDFAWPYYAASGVAFLWFSVLSARATRKQVDRVPRHAWQLGAQFAGVTNGVMLLGLALR